MDGQEHRRELSEFVDLAAHRAEGCGCSKSGGCSSHTSTSARAESSRSERPARGDADALCGNSSFRLDPPFDPRILARIGDSRHEVVFDVSEDERERRPPNPWTRLSVVNDLVVVRGRSFEPAGPGGMPYQPLGFGPPPSLQKEIAPPPSLPSAPYAAIRDCSGPDGSHPQFHDQEFRWSSKCNGVEQVGNRFWLAYQICRSAELELRSYLQHWGDDAKLRELWNAHSMIKEASLAWWFGSDSSRWFHTRLTTVAYRLACWSWCFRHGFWGDPIVDKAVLIRCHPNEGKNKAAYAYHAEPNVVTLLGPWFKLKDLHPFDVAEAQQAIALLHEMGHYSGSGGQDGVAAAPYGVPTHFWMNAWKGALEPPRDRRNDVCDGSPGNRCYQTAIWTLTDLWYTGGRPRLLVDEFQKGSDDAYDDMMDNVDNYTSYMWNRWQDRGYCRMVVT